MQLFEEDVVPDKPKAEDDPIPKAFAYFVEKAGKSERYTLTEKRIKKARLRWKEEEQVQKKLGVPRDKLRSIVGQNFKHVIDELTSSTYHRENGFLEWEQIFDSRERFERWLDRWENDYSAKHNKNGRAHA